MFDVFVELFLIQGKNRFKGHRFYKFRALLGSRNFQRAIAIYI